MEGHQRTCVNNLCGDAVLLLQNLGCLHGGIERCTHREDGDVRPCPLDVRLADLNFIALRRHRAEFIALAVESLALEEEHRVRPIQGRGHHAFCVIRRCGEHHLQPGHMGSQAGPVLRMLCAVKCAYRNAQHHRHLNLACGHALPFGQLVEDLISRSAHKVCIHQLNHASAAQHGVPHAGGNNRRLGNRAVKQAVEGDRLVHAGVYAECSAPFSHVFTVGDQGRILIEFVKDRLKNSVSVAVDRAGGNRGSILLEGIVGLLLDLFPAGVLLLRSEHVRLPVCHLRDLLVGEHVFLNGVRLFLKVHSRGDGFIHCQEECLFNVPLHLCLKSCKVFLGGNACLHQLCLEHLDAVDLLPCLNLLSGAVGVLV